MTREKWTKERILEVARQYPNVKAWKQGNMPSYQAAQRYKILKQARSLLSSELHRKWDETSLRQEALKYTSKIEWIRKDHAAYQSAYDLGILDDITSHMKRREKWTKEAVLKEASKYEYVQDWRLASPKTWGWARANGIYKECIKHMAKSRTHSLAEYELLEYVQQYQPTAHSKHFGKYEIDIYIPELNLGIEYNGLYHHSEKSKGRQYHLNKTNYFKELGINIIHIWEHEWRDSREQVCNFLRPKLKAAKTVGARKCEFKIVDVSVARDFCNKNHIQKAPNTISIAIGAYYQNNLVGVCTFSPHHRGLPEIVLSRLCFESDIIVAGALSKFSKLAYEHFKQPIYTWVHLTLSDGASYMKSGWEFVEQLPPDYFYTASNGKYVSKQSRRKRAVNTPTGMTEYEHAVQDGLYRVWDCGKLKLVYNPVNL